MDSTLSIIGSIASIAGAAWSFWQAKQSASSAKRAQELRDEIVNRRKIYEISQLSFETKKILQVVSDIGPSSNVEVLWGFNTNKIAKEIEEFARFLKEQSSHFSESNQNMALLLCKDLKTGIEALSEARSPKDIKEHGKFIYNKIDDFMPIVKDLADEKREQISK